MATGTWCAPARRSRRSPRLFGLGHTRPIVRSIPSGRSARGEYGDAPIGDRDHAPPWATAGPPPQPMRSAAASATMFTAIGDPAEGLHRDLVQPSPQSPRSFTSVAVTRQQRRSVTFVVVVDASLRAVEPAKRERLQRAEIDPHRSPTRVLQLTQLLLGFYSKRLGLLPRKCRTVLYA